MRNTALLSLALLTVATVITVAQRAETRATDSPDVALKTAMNRELIDGDFMAVVQQYREIATRYRSVAPRTAAKALVQMAASYEKLGTSGAVDARRAYEQVVREFPGERDAVAIARVRLGGVAQASTVPRVTLRSVKTGDASGTVSADGRYLSSTEYDDGNLHVRDLRSGTDRVLTRRKDFNIGLSVVSPDNSQVVYQVWDRGCAEQAGGLPALCLVSLSGDGVPTPRTLFESRDVLDITPMDWSPDGRLVAVSLHRSDRSNQIGLVTVADGSLTVLQSVDWRGPTRVVFSPDGREVAFDLSVGDTGERRDIFVRSTDGTDGRTAVEHDSQNIVMDWTPDGAALLFASNRSGTMDLWAQPFRDRRPHGAPRLIRASLGGAWSLGMTTAGSLYFGARTSDRDIAVTTVDLATGKQVAATARPVQKNVGTTAMPDWSPDGKYLAYISQRGFNPTNNSGRVVCVRTLSTGAVVDLYPKLTYINHLHWKPDSSAILTSGTDVMGRSGVFSIDARTGDLSLIVQGPVGCTSCSINMYPKWSPDGKRVFYRKIDPNAYFTNVTIVERDLTSQSERAVASGALGIFSVSPDGQSIAAIKGGLSGGGGQAAVVQIRVTTGETRDLLRAKLNERIPVWTGLPWTPDGLAVLVRKQTPNEIWLVPTTGASPRKLDLNVSGWSFGPIGVIGLSPDGRRIASTTGGLNSEVMVLENFLPAHPETPTATLAISRVLEQGEPWDRISPDGRYLARSDNSTLTLRDLATGRMRALISNGNPDDPDHRYPLASAFSRDGSQIAYQWYLEQSLRSVLRVVSTAGKEAGDPRTLYDNPDLSFIPTDWSPDGRWISGVVEGKDRLAKIGLVSVADGALRILKTVDWSRRVGGLRFSPDSSLLAYHRPGKEDDFNRDVFVIAIDGSKEIVAANSPGDDKLLEWRPDGHGLLIASDRGGSMSVWSVPASGQSRTSSYELVKSDIGIISSLGPTNDGVFYYNLLPSSSGIYTATFDATSGQLSSSPVQPIQQFKGQNASPQWSSDGKYLAFGSRRDVPAPINVVRIAVPMLSMATGKVVRELYPSLSYGGVGRWSPNGRQFIVRGSDLKGRDGILTVDASTGEATLIVTNETCSGVPYWAPDGRSFFCYRWQGAGFAQSQIVQVDVNSRAVLRTFVAAGQGAGVSPDGRHIVYQDGVTHFLKLLALASGESHDIIRVAPPSSQIGNFGTIDWTPDSRSVVFYGRLNGVDGMWRVPIDGGAPQEIYVNVGPIFSWRFHAKTGQVAFSTSGAGPRLEMWKMENFLPVTAQRLR